MHYKYKTKNTCSSEIEFDIDNNKIYNVRYTGGCNGNLKAISKLVDGMTVEEIEGKLKGNICGFRDTSCADQLAQAVRKAYEEEKSK